jgi:nicotinate-nucleotide pyrophosphorylase (carboxylating)
MMLYDFCFLVVHLYIMEPNFKEVERIISAALAEDIGAGDVTAELLIPEETTAELAFVTREEIVMCGGWIVPRVFERIDPNIKVDIKVEEGEKAVSATRLIEVSGHARAIVTAERVALNLMQRMSSVATIASRYVETVQGTGVKILDTRKTMPGMRELDKYAVRIGGAQNLRMRLDDGILIKDNHIAMCGNIKTALKKAKAGNVNNLPIEIECDTIKQVEEAIEAGAKIIMLDNMSLAMMRDAVAINRGRAILEASGNVTLKNVRSIAETGVNRISVGRITHSVPSVDIGLDVTLK